MTRATTPAEKREKRARKDRERKRRYWQNHKVKLNEKRLAARREKALPPPGPQVLGTASTYDELVGLLAARRRALGERQLAIDYISGMQDGYTGKLEIGRERGGRTMGRITTALWLAGLGVQLQVVEVAKAAPPNPAKTSRSSRARPQK